MSQEEEGVSEKVRWCETRTLGEILQSTEGGPQQMHSEKRWVNSRGLVGHCNLPLYPKRLYIKKRVNFLQGVADSAASSKLRLT